MAFKTEEKIFTPIDGKINPDLLGHKDNEKVFLQAIQSGNCHHAWLLSGNKGIGKFTFACRVARFIFATAPEVQNTEMEFWEPVKKIKKTKSAAAAEAKQPQSFGMFSGGFDFGDDVGGAEDDADESNDSECENVDSESVSGLSSNVQKKSKAINEKRLRADSLQIDKSDKIFDQIVLGTFSDLKIITPDFANNKKEISVDDILKIREFFQVTSSMGDYRVVIIDALDDLNSNSANALLKILEEPPPMTLFFLVCHNVNNILDTIKSRARVLNFHPLHDEIVERLLFENIGDIDKDLVKNLIALCHGSIGNAYDLYNANAPAVAEDIKNILQNLRAGRAKNLSKFATELARNSHKYSAFKNLAMCLMTSAIEKNIGALDDENISADFCEIIDMISDGGRKNIQHLADAKSDIESMFAKCDEVNLERESVVILTLKKVLE